VDRAILTRHAESTYSAKDMVNGDPYRYVGLSPKGKEQARQLGQQLKDEPIDLCVTSRFPRTRETADIVLEGRAIPRLVLPELDDVRMGDFEGHDVSELRAWQLEHGPAAPVPGGGESRVESIQRFVRGYRILLGREEPSIFVVTHGLPVTAVLIALKGEDIPLTLEGIQVHSAEPYFVSADELKEAVTHLERWVNSVPAA
jgi:broad specificity phosphatase PhoE